MKTVVLTALFLTGFSANAFNEATLEQAEIDGVALTSGWHHTCGIREDGTIACFGDDGEDQLKDFPEGVRFKSVSAGWYHTCGIKEDGTIACFGDDGKDQLKDFPEGIRFKSISAGGNHTCGINEDGELLFFGQDNLEQRKDFPKGVRFKSISAGVYHTCGIKDDSELLCFGANHNYSQRRDFPEGVRFKSISAGAHHTCGIKEDGELLCFGGDEHDQRKGMSTEEFWSYPVLVLGSFERGLLKLSRLVYPEKVNFVKSLSQITQPLSESQGDSPDAARLLAFNYLEPFLSAIETEAIESKVLPRYRSELAKWNKMAGVAKSSDIFFSDQSYSVSLDYLIASLRACAPLESDEANHSEINQLLTSLGEIKASGVVRVRDILLELDSHEDLLNNLRQSSATKGFAVVIEQVRGYLAAQIRELK